MDFIEIVLALIILGTSFVVSAKKDAKKREPMAQPTHSEDSSLDEADESWEIFAENDEDMFSDEMAEPVYADNAETEYQNHYFTYEDESSVDNNNDTMVETVAETPQTPLMPEIRTMFSEGFDLRQAIIYQTVLERK